MRTRALLVLLASLVTAVAVVTVVIEVPASTAGQRVTLAPPRTTSEAVVLSGRAPARARVRIVRRAADGWARVAFDRANRRGRYRVTVQRPEQTTWVVRAVSGGMRSGRRTIAPVPPPVEPAPVEPPVVPAPVDACGEQPQKADGTWWECTFVDDFDGTELDTAKWLAQETAGSGVISPEYACLVSSPSTIAVGGGQLRLSGERSTTPFTCRSPLGDFSTNLAAAGITTRGRFNQAYGRFEFRAKMPDTLVAGAHSALWLYPNQHTYGRWPLSGEIDVAEWYSSRPELAFPSVHYVDGLRNIHTGWDGVIANASSYHTYAVEWTPTVMRFYYDGTLTYQHSWTPLAPLVGSQPFDQAFNVVLNQAWGGPTGNAPTSQTPNRITMTVDWVRVWK
jgi:beta-glucanase (GH16 family)